MIMRILAGLLASTLAQNTEPSSDFTSNIDFNDIVLSKTTAAYLESTGFDLTGWSIIKEEDIYPDNRGQSQEGSENRGLVRSLRWEPLHEYGRIVIPFFVDDSYESGKLTINKAMKDLEKVLGCFEFRNVTRDGSFDYKTGGIVFKQNQESQKCYSTLGRFPSYKIANLKVPLRWQAINMGNNCYGGDYGASQHEMLHALGVMHEQQRPDNYKYIYIDETHPDYSAQWKPMKFYEWYDVKSTYEPWSIMHYPLNGAPATLKNGFHTYPAKRITTTDALQIQTMYCKNQPDKFPKWNNTKTAQCTKEDLSGTAL